MRIKRINLIIGGLCQDGLWAADVEGDLLGPTTCG